MRDILAVDVTPEMIAAVEEEIGKASTLGNEACVRTWVGDVADVPAYQVLGMSLQGGSIDEEQECLGSLAALPSCS